MASVQFWTEAQETKLVLAKAQIKSVFVSGRIIKKKRIFFLFLLKHKIQKNFKKVVKLIYLYLLIHFKVFKVTPSSLFNMFS